MAEHDTDRSQIEESGGRLLSRFTPRGRNKHERTGEKRATSQQAESVHCPHCGRLARPGWKHCIYCGATLSACPKCGAPRQNVPGEAFCAECGTSLGPPSDLPTVPLDPQRPPDAGDNEL
jgi:hypothetical protein